MYIESPREATITREMLSDFTDPLSAYQRLKGRGIKFYRLFLIVLPSPSARAPFESRTPWRKEWRRSATHNS